MEKAVVIALLRGGSCTNCRYFLTAGREYVNGMVEYVDLNPPHCSLRTDLKGQPVERSKLENPFRHSCKNFWKKADRTW